MRDRKIDLLDHGYVRLVDWMGDDLSVVRAARVSYDAAWRAGDDTGSDRRLIRYLWRNKHTSPFESVTFTFEVKAPIFVFRQWHRHRTWCLAGDTQLVFDRPVDGCAFPVSIADVVRKWNHNPPVRRPDKQARSLRDFNRERIGGMRLRAPGGAVNITDAWHSGEKRVFNLRTKYGAVTASADHVFKTPNGEAKLGDNPKHVMALARVGGDKEAEAPTFSSNELQHEHWVEFIDGYEVSDLGRVRSYWGQGARRKRAEPFIKQQSLNGSGRAVVGIKGKALQVSTLVADAFLGGEGFVLHGDDNPLDNRLRNLRRGTAKDNASDQYVNGGRVRMREVPVEVIDITFGGAVDTFDISVTGDHWFCANGLVVHNSFNEVSARYTELPEEFYLPRPEMIGEQSKDNKQARTIEPLPGEVILKRKYELSRVGSYAEDCFMLYRDLLSAGWPRELARTVLPMSTYSKMFASVDLLNLMKFLQLRDHAHAQYEIRVYAEAMKKLAASIVPECINAMSES